jgi:hypothetical protein
LNRTRPVFANFNRRSPLISLAPVPGSIPQVIVEKSSMRATLFPAVVLLVVSTAARTQNDTASPQPAEQVN